MHELWSSASYEPHLLSLPFAFAPAVMMLVIAYAIVMRGEPLLRACLLVHFVALMPYSIVMALSPSVTSPAAAETLFRLAAAFIPTAAAAGAGFHFVLLRRGNRALAIAAGVVSLAWIVAGAVTDAAVAGVYRLPAGLWYADAGPYAWLALVTTMVVAAPGFLLMARAATTMKPSLERRQLRVMLLANMITYCGLTDVLLAYRIGVFPLGWLLSGIGSVIVVRALVFEDLLRVRAIDTTAPRLLVHLVLALVIGWVALELLEPGLAWWGAAAVLAVAFASVRVLVAVIALVARGARGGDSTLDRLLGQLVTRARALRGEPEIAKLAADIIELGVGARVTMLIAAADDWGWTTADGTRLADDVAPDPLLGPWLAEQRGAILASELNARAPEELRAPLTGVLDRAKAGALVPVTSSDELLALLLVPDSRRVRGRELAFVERAGDRLGEALVHARMAQRAAERATLAREVDLAATVQAHLLPGRGPRIHGDVTIVGSWQPATRCAGDFWAVFPLAPATGEGPTNRLLVAIGDVTGHGVASATVTAAAAAACDVCARQRGDALELGDVVAALDAAVARVGGGQLAMSCFAAILDPAAKTISYVSCGHPTPYLCRTGPKGLELHALVARGNPLGIASAAPVKAQQRALEAGDLVVWYTDGVIDAQDPRGEPFGDRRMQRLLRRIDPALGAAAIHDLVNASIAAHRAGRQRNDDETLVIARVGASP
ncbi:MAG TPA: SpoIIE family protein phosphatase [Kofleriaceae bacterium]|jgi:serine phosphatase RsbU (regulator of sigma subunit)